MAVNSNFLAISWNSAGGSVAIFDASNPIRCPANLPLVRGHKSQIVDVKFSPFRQDLLATASNDNTVKLWEIPQGGLTKDLNEELQNFTGHARKVSFVNFNPVCSDLIGSASFDNSVQVWNMLKAETISKCNLAEYPTSMGWNNNGSLIACTSKDKHIYVFDPRSNNIIVKVKGHDSPKTMKMTWIDENKIISTGFNKSNTREMKLWDIRKVKEDLTIESCLQTHTIDHQSGIPTPYFDKDIKMLYIFGRGEGNTHYYDLGDGSIKPCNDYLSNEPTDAVVMFEKKCMDYNKCELARFAKYSRKTIIYLSFNYPKKNVEFDPQLYPPTFCGEPSLTLDEWMNGNNKEPLVKDIREIENKWVSQAQSFEKKTQQPTVQSSGNDNEKRAKLEKQINDLNKRIQELDSENKQLKAEIKKYKSMVKTTEIKQISEIPTSSEIPETTELPPKKTEVVETSELHHETTEIETTELPPKTIEVVKTSEEPHETTEIETTELPPKKIEVVETSELHHETTEIETTELPPKKTEVVETSELHHETTEIETTELPPKTIEVVKTSEEPHETTELPPKTIEVVQTSEEPHETTEIETTELPPKTIEVVETSELPQETTEEHPQTIQILQNKEEEETTEKPTEITEMKETTEMP